MVKVCHKKSMEDETKMYWCVTDQLNIKVIRSSSQGPDFNAPMES